MYPTDYSFMGEKDGKSVWLPTFTDLCNCPKCQADKQFFDRYPVGAMLSPPRKLVKCKKCKEEWINIEQPN